MNPPRIQKKGRYFCGEYLQNTPFGVLRMPNCYSDAFINQKYVLPELNLVPKAGSLGIGKDKVLWEFGGIKYDDFATFVGPNGLDGHVWLEDSKGLVYDYIRPNMTLPVRLWGLSFGYPLEGQEIFGLSKANLSKSGLHYLEAGDAIQIEILEWCRKACNIDEIFSECKTRADVDEILENHRSYFTSDETK